MRLNPSQASPGRGPGSSRKIDENCRLSHDPYHCMIQAVALRLHMIQAFSTCIKPLSCDPALKCSSLQCHHASQHIFTQVWGIGLAGLQVLTSELRIPNPKNRFPSPTSAIFGFVSEHSEHLQHSATLELTLELAATSLPHCVSTRIIGTTRASTAKGGPNNQEIRNATNPHPHSGGLWRPFRL